MSVPFVANAVPGAPDLHHPVTRFVATRDGTRLAAQRFGSGPDFLVLTGGFSNVEMRWEEPRLARSWRRVASFSTVMAYDPRGFGLSRAAVAPSSEVSVADAIDVMDAFGVEHAAVHGSYEAGPVALLLAAKHPERIDQVFLENTSAKGVASDDHPHAMAIATWEALRRIVDNATLDEMTDVLAPDRAHEPEFREWYGRWARYGAGPGGLAAVLDRVAKLDVRAALPHVQCPVTVIHRFDHPLIPLTAAEYLVGAVPDGRLVVLDGDTNWFSNTSDESIDAIEAAVGGRVRTNSDDQTRCSMVVSDIVDSTAVAAELGDTAWRTVLDEHDRAVANVVIKSGGRLVKNTGDGALAVFGDSASATCAALAVRDAVASVGLRCRVGVHTGDVVRRGHDIGGLAVQIAARVCAEASPDAVLVTESVSQDGVKHDIALRALGARTLKGVPDPHLLFVAERAG